MQLKNKNIFVTGSSRGIGLAIAHKFAQLGHLSYAPKKKTWYLNKVQSG